MTNFHESSTSARIDYLGVVDRCDRPMLRLAIGMVVLSGIIAILAVADTREVLGQNAWFKPLKFAISIGIYAMTLAWMIGQARRWRRALELLGRVTVVALVVEIVIIVGAAACGTTSHFNVATPLNTTLWAIMAVSITIVWLASLAVGIALALNPGPDQARNLAMCAGVALGFIGMGIAFLMTGPTQSQLNEFQGIAGAHAVGVEDGGAGLPFLGWSTEGGDLRIPHFIGMHGLQMIPLGLLLIEELSQKIRCLSSPIVRIRLVAISTCAYFAMTLIATWQALIGESVIAPSTPTLIATALVPVGSAIAIATVLVNATQRTSTTTQAILSEVRFKE